MCKKKINRTFQSIPIQLLFLRIRVRHKSFRAVVSDLLSALYTYFVSDICLFLFFNILLRTNAHGKGLVSWFILVSEEPVIIETSEQGVVVCMTKNDCSYYQPL